MTSVICGTHRLTLLAGPGGRIERGNLRTALPDPLRQAEGRSMPPPFILGRQEQIGVVDRAIRNRAAVNFHASCGFGKTTLLRNVVALGATRGATARHVYLNTGPFGLDDLLQRIVGELFTTAEPVRLTSPECEQILGHANAVIALDDVGFAPERVEYLRRVMPGCALIIGSQQPVLGSQGETHALGGLAASVAVSLLAQELRRSIGLPEYAAARSLIDAVDGQPLHIRQAAALIGSGEQSFASLAQRVAGRPEELDRLSLNALDADERRLLAVCAFTAGALLPVGLVGAMTDFMYVGEKLSGLFRKGLVEHPDDRFGLPVCKAEPYRALLFQYFELGSSVRGLLGWLASRAPGGAEAESGLEAAVSVLGFAADQRQWQTVIRIVRVVEPILFVHSRWAAWLSTLEQGIEAARQAGDAVSEAYFAHQKGTLHYFRNEAQTARQYLERALRLRNQLGDREGAALTRANLAFLGVGLSMSAPPPQSPFGRPGQWRKPALIGAAVVAIVSLALAAGSALGGDDRDVTTPPTIPGQSSSTTVTDPSSSQSSTTSTPPASPDKRPAAPGAEPATMDFLLTHMNPDEAAPTKEITVRNTGEEAGIVESIRLTGSDSFATEIDECSGITLQPKQASSCKVTVAFAPQEVGKVGAKLIVALGGKKSKVDLEGTGYVNVTVEVTQADDKAEVKSHVTGYRDSRECSDSCEYRASSVGFSLTAHPGTIDTYVEKWEECTPEIPSNPPVCKPILTGDSTVKMTFRYSVIE
ncbi:hypothetical protein [Streptomyces canus]|uniref:hypothetical protein n=1 Tax=Streptomyces canus TaxID=58343 RepID=UPI0037237316